jgi:bifunctional DNA-binding transcriptional regulator/antitoxin component of YhaV-PrlF toxin-antitoxin module
MTEKGGARRESAPTSFVARVGARNQITIPSTIADLLHLNKTSIVRVEITKLEPREEQE